ncbi:hypothetical protein FD677_23980 [Escherichia coli]|nr:hypothetical protein [Escherichia coli]
MAEPYRYAGWLLRNDASARARDKEGMIFVRKRGKTGVLIIAELFTGRLRWGRPCPVGRRQVSPMG